KAVQYGASSFLFGLKLQPAQVVLLSFIGWIFIGALLLALPISSVDGKGMSFIDAVFMATSATCVTGLATASLAADLSIFGQVVIFLLLQVGGLGIMTVSSSMAIMMGQNLHMTGQVSMQDVLDSSNTEELTGLIVDIIRYTFTVEFVG